MPDCSPKSSTVTPPSVCFEVPSTASITNESRTTTWFCGPVAQPKRRSTGRTRAERKRVLSKLGMFHLLSENRVQGRLSELEMQSQSAELVAEAPSNSLHIRLVIPVLRGCGCPKAGLVHSLLGLDHREAVLGHPIAGDSWEGFVVENILRAASERTVASFYRTAAGAEIDLLLEMPNPGTLGHRNQARPRPQARTGLPPCAGGFEPGSLFRGIFRRRTVS